VYFSPSSDAFQYLPPVQEVTFQTMSILLDAGIEIAFLTKGFVGERFLALFAKAPQRVFAQVGITSLDRRIWKTLEPRTAPPTQRIESIRQLRAIGVETTARFDPLIPDLTDTEISLRPLLAALKTVGLTRASASFLFLRSCFAERLLTQLDQLAPAGFAAAWKHRNFVDGCGGGRMATSSDRAARFGRLSVFCAEHGIELDVCRCKNPELGSPGCHIAGPALAPANQATPQHLLEFP
jgi:hypothetical protein